MVHGISAVSICGILPQGEPLYGRLFDKMRLMGIPVVALSPDLSDPARSLEEYGASLNASRIVFDIRQCFFAELEIEQNKMYQRWQRKTPRWRRSQECFLESHPEIEQNKRALIEGVEHLVQKASRHALVIGHDLFTKIIPPVVEAGLIVEKPAKQTFTEWKRKPFYPVVLHLEAGGVLILENRAQGERWLKAIIPPVISVASFIEPSGPCASYFDVLVRYDGSILGAAQVFSAFSREANNAFEEFPIPSETVPQSVRRREASHGGAMSLVIPGSSSSSRRRPDKIIEALPATVPDEVTVEKWDGGGRRVPLLDKDIPDFLREKAGDVGRQLAKKGYYVTRHGWLPGLDEGALYLLKVSAVGDLKIGKTSYWVLTDGCQPTERAARDKHLGWLVDGMVDHLGRMNKRA